MTTGPVTRRRVIAAMVVDTVGVAALTVAVVLQHGLPAVGVPAGVTGFLTTLVTVAVALKNRVDDTVDRPG